MNVDDRARVHAALGDKARLRIVDALAVSDLTFQVLAAAAGLPGNAAAHHLQVLEAAGLIERHASEADRRHRYFSLRHDRLDGLVAQPSLPVGRVLFVCTHNSARSPFAAAFWERQTGQPAQSAGSEPAPRVNPQAVRTAAEFGVDISAAIPKGYGAVSGTPDLVISVCDRATEAGPPTSAPSIHWSIQDPVLAGGPAAFHSAFAEIARRVDRLASANEPRQEALP